MGRGRGWLVFLPSGGELVSNGLFMKQGEPLVTQSFSPTLTLMIQARLNCCISLLSELRESQTDRQTAYCIIYNAPFKKRCYKELRPLKSERKKKLFCDTHNSDIKSSDGGASERLNIIHAATSRVVLL